MRARQSQIQGECSSKQTQTQIEVTEWAATKWANVFRSFSSSVVQSCFRFAYNWMVCKRVSRRQNKFSRFVALPDLVAYEVMILCEFQMASSGRFVNAGQNQRKLTCNADTAKWALGNEVIDEVACLPGEA